MNRLRILTAAVALSPAWLAAQQATTLATQSGDAVLMRTARLEGQSGPVTGKPYIATETRHTTQTLADGSHVDQSDTSSFARDEAGRMRTGNANTVVIFDPVAGVTYTLDPRFKTYNKSTLAGNLTSYSVAVSGNRTSTSSTASFQNHVAVTKVSAPKAGEEELPVQFIDGLLAKGSRVTTTIPAGTFGNDKDIKVVTERWYSDDMQILLKSSNSDPRFGTTTYELTGLLTGPPDPSLFQVPADYQLRTAH